MWWGWCWRWENYGLVVFFLIHLQPEHNDYANAQLGSVRGRFCTTGCHFRWEISLTLPFYYRNVPWIQTSTLCVLFNIRLRDNLPCFKFSYWLGVDDISRLVLFRSVLDLFNLVWKRAIIEPLCLFYTAFNMMSILEVNDSVTSSSYIYS